MPAGEAALMMVYGGKDGDSLSTLRHSKFVQKVTSSTSFMQSASLPPTSASAKFHSMRVYYQVQYWIGNTLDPLCWGWEEKNRVYLPVMTDIPPAPQSLLNLVKCACKGDCSTYRCSCRKPVQNAEEPVVAMHKFLYR